MRTQIATRPLPPLPDNPSLPHQARITSIRRMAADNHLFQLRFVEDQFVHHWSHLPGQFVELSVIGTGEAPISISSSPTRRGILEHRDRFGTITLMYGAKTPADMLFRDELEALAGTSSINTLLTVDRDPTGTWEHEIGLLPT